MWFFSTILNVTSYSLFYQWGFPLRILSELECSVFPGAFKCRFTSLVQHFVEFYLHILHQFLYFVYLFLFSLKIFLSCYICLKISKILLFTYLSGSSYSSFLLRVITIQYAIQNTILHKICNFGTGTMSLLFVTVSALRVRQP